MEIENSTYKNRLISVVASDTGLKLSIDKKIIAVSKASANEGYASPLLPYQTFDSLMDLGKAIVRTRHWTKIAHERTE
jgi:hypothetical protein